MARITVNQFRKLFPASVAPSSLLNGKVSITINLKSYWGDRKVDELAKFVDILDVPGRHLHLYRIKKGCIAVVWLCSITDVKEQKGALWEANHVSLQNMGVVQLLIGEALVFFASDSGKTSEENMPCGDSGQTPRDDSDRKDYVAGAAVGGVSGGLAGAGVGAVVGAGVGMVVGSVIPGPGTALGLLIGAFVGGGIGLVAGGGAGGGIGTGIGVAAVAKKKKAI